MMTEPRASARFQLAISFLALAACGGGGSDSPSPTPQPTVTLTANPASIAAGQTSTLTWSSTNASACTASDGWSGAKAASGTEAVSPLATTSYSLNCTGAGGSAAQAVTVTVAAGANVVVSGRVEFERPPFKAAVGSGLDMDNPVVSPARQVVVEAVVPGTRTRIGSATTTDSNGNYSLTVPQNTQMLISARAEMVNAGGPSWNFKILNNTNGNALYVLDGGAFNSGTASSTRNLRALTGWNGTTYPDPLERTAAPFAILDTVYQAKELIRSAASSTVFPPLNVYWSPQNRPSDDLCTNIGNVTTTFYSPGETDAGNCTQSGPIAAGIYVLGDFANGNGDTDEFDQSVIAHEFGHYFQGVFSRDDSIGGTHSSLDRLDPRVAFSEGWGDAWSAIVLGDPVYRDSDAGVSSEGTHFNIENDFTTVEGWFSEFSVAEIIWDLFDSVADGADQIALGFQPIYAAMTGGQKTTDALTTIFSFAQALRSVSPGQVAGINALLTAEQISANSDDFGNNETNAGGSPTATPIYTQISLAAPVQVCTSATWGAENKLGNTRYLRLDVSTAGLISVRATGTASGPAISATDPDIFVYRRGAIVAFGDSTVPGDELTGQFAVTPGTYIIEVFDWDLSGTNSIQHCMLVSVTGTAT